MKIGALLVTLLFLVMLQEYSRTLKHIIVNMTLRT